VKRMVWPARDRRDLGGPVIPGELVATLRDEEGRPISARDLWRCLAEDAPASVSTQARRAFADAIDSADRGACTNQLEPVLALEAAFDVLARLVKGG
jgi:hypothetical protein